MVVVVFLVVCGRDGNGCGGNGRCGTCTGPCGGTLGVMVVMVLVVGVVVVGSIVAAAAGGAGAPQEAMDLEVKARQLALAQHARRGAAEAAVGARAPDDDVAADLAAHPGDDLVRRQAVAARLVDPAVEQAALFWG